MESKAEKDEAMKTPKINIHLNRQKLLQHKTSRCVSIIIMPLRIFQFLAVLLLFAFTIYMIVMDPILISILACILLIVLSGVYIFVLAVELINHFIGSAFHVIPMAIFSFLGVIFFGVAGILLIFNAFTKVVEIVAMGLCLLAALLFLIDITMVLAFWKRRCTACKQCCSNSMTKLPLYKNEVPNTSEAEIIKHDVTTSLSDVRVPHELENVAMPDHCYRKIGYPQRREYVDCPTCVPSLCNLSVAQIQTEMKKVSMESQTPRAITTETPTQTLIKCEFCQQQIQLPFAEGTGIPSTFQQSSQWSYPAIVQFIRGGTSAQPCCFGCKCSMDTAQTQQQQQKLTQKRVESQTPKDKSNSSKTLLNETITQQVAITENGNDNVTRLTEQPITTVASFYDSDKKMQTVPETIKSEIAEETTFEQVNVKKRNEDDAAESEEKTIEADEKIERSKGGGESSYAEIYQEFIRATEQENMINLEEPSMHKGGTLIAPLSSRRSRTLLHLKSNKVDPIKDVDVFDEDYSLEKVILRTALDQAAQENEHPARTELPNPINEQLNDACSFCRRQKNLTPTSDNSRCYTIFKDKKGKFFCEFCAPLDSKKIISRLESTDLRKLRCTNCRLHLRNRDVRTKLKSDTCPKCGRSQRHAASPSST